MELDLNYPALVAFLLVVVRTVGWLIVAPPFSDRKVVPPWATMAIAAGFGVLISPEISRAAVPTDAAGLIGAIVVELVTGAAIGLLVNLLISAITSAGSMVDLEGGLNLPSAIDPLGLDQTPMMGQFYQQVAMLLLFVTHGYVLLVQGFARSFSAPGFTLGATKSIATVMTADFTTYFLSALEIAGPILMVLFATQVVLALLAKAAPQMNVWILGMPLQVFLSLMLVAIGISVVPTYLGELVTRAVSDAGVLFGNH